MKSIRTTKERESHRAGETESPKRREPSPAILQTAVRRESAEGLGANLSALGHRRKKNMFKRVTRI